MAASYKRLFKLLIDRNMKKKELAEKDFKKYNEYMMEEEREWKEFLKQIGEDEDEDE